jgi:hypothetical protein
MISAIAWLGVFALVIAVCVLPWRLTRFEYRIDNNKRTLVIVMMWCGVVPITKQIAAQTIHLVRRTRNVWEIVPLVSGTLPSLWGRFRPRTMVLVVRKGWRALLPLVVTPEYPDEFIDQVRNLSPEH